MYVSLLKVGNTYFIVVPPSGISGEIELLQHRFEIIGLFRKQKQIPPQEVISHVGVFEVVHLVRESDLIISEYPKSLQEMNKKELLLLKKKLDEQSKLTVSELLQRFPINPIEILDKHQLAKGHEQERAG